LRTRRARDLPNPAEQPVMSQTRGFWDVILRVNVMVSKGVMGLEGMFMVRGEKGAGTENRK
jgi:hypothetical protein